MSSVLDCVLRKQRGETGRPAPRRPPGTRLLVVGAAAFVLVLAGWIAYEARRAPDWTLYPVDFDVYRDGGLIIRHISPPYDPKAADPLYGWSRTALLAFTYTPFSAVAFALVSFVPPALDPRLTEVVNVAALAGAAWCVMRGLGWAGWRARAGGALLGAAAGLVTEPVFRTVYLGQINIVLMLMILWDLTQPDTPRSRWWKGFLTGVAAGVKLVPLIFVPYLLLTRRFRQALTALAGFAFTVVVGFAVAPSGSADFWFRALFLSDGRTGFPGWGGNQSLHGMITRLAGSVDAANLPWLASALAVAAAGLAAAALLDRAGHLMLGLLTTALVGLLDSPISWDHHWVWVMPGLMAAAHYAVAAWRSKNRAAVGDLALDGAGQAASAGQARGGRTLAVSCAAAVAVGLLVFAPWPGRLWSAPVLSPGTFTWGLVWAASNSRVVYFFRYGDQPWYKEYHWHALQLLAGNSYVLIGLAALVACCVTAVAVTARRPLARRSGLCVVSEMPGLPGAAAPPLS